MPGRYKHDVVRWPDVEMRMNQAAAEGWQIVHIATTTTRYPKDDEGLSSEDLYYHLLWERVGVYNEATDTSV